MDRRRFLQTGLTSAVAAPVSQPLFAQAGRTGGLDPGPSGQVWLRGDTSPADPARTAGKLAALAARGIRPDAELNGGAVAALESRFAALLGKEDCVFLPTGTLANQLALRVLSQGRPRVLVQHESHIYRDESDAAQILSGINLVPLARGRASPTLEEVAAAVEEAASSPFPVRVGAIALESPVRRAAGEMIDPAVLRAISGYARANDIRLHLDGARLLLAPPGHDISGYAALFDTVYVSLYKYLDAPQGAILAGPRDVIDEVRLLRHPFGGTVAQGWPAAALAMAALEDFGERHRRMFAAAAVLFSTLEARKLARLRPASNASNIRFLELAPGVADGLAERTSRAGVHIFPPEANALKVQINETLLHRPAGEIAASFSP